MQKMTLALMVAFVLGGYGCSSAEKQAEQRAAQKAAQQQAADKAHQELNRETAQ